MDAVCRNLRGWAQQVFLVDSFSRDDTVDIALRVVMGALCHPVPINGNPTDLGLCDPSDAPVGNAPFTDGAPISASELQNVFPYLNNPIPGATNN